MKSSRNISSVCMFDFFDNHKKCRKSGFLRQNCTMFWSVFSLFWSLLSPIWSLFNTIFSPCGLNFLPISSLCPHVPTISATLWPCKLLHKRGSMVLSVGCLSILEIDLHFPPPVRLSDLCTLWCHGEYCVRLLFELKGKWCFDNLYISNWKVEINNFWLLRLLTGFWLRARWLDSVPSYLIHLYHPRLTFHHVVIFKSKSKLYTSYIHLPKWQMNLSLSDV